MTCGFPTLNQSKKIFNEILSNQHFFEGDRNQVRAQSAETAIKDTINFLKNIIIPVPSTVKIVKMEGCNVILLKIKKSF